MGLYSSFNPNNLLKSFSSFKISEIILLFFFKILFNKLINSPFIFFDFNFLLLFLPLPYCVILTKFIIICQISSGNEGMITFLRFNIKLFLRGITMSLSKLSSKNLSYDFSIFILTNRTAIMAVLCLEKIFTGFELSTTSI